MDLLDSLFATLPSKSTILSLVDDYTLFCYYLEQDVVINQAILSPIRRDKADTLPSFSIFYGRDQELKFHDYALGKTGDVFQFIKELYGFESYEEVYYKISDDFGLGLLGTVSNPAKRIEFLKPQRLMNKGFADVVNYPEFSDEAKLFWNQYKVITLDILKEYNVNQARLIITDDGYTVRIDSLAFSYRIGLKHKIYQPFNKEFKFRNNFPKNYVEGYVQLTERWKQGLKSEVLFITKSLKDVMVFRGLGVDAIAPKAENNEIPAFIIEELKREYKYIFVLFDDDGAGNKGRIRYPDFPAIWLSHTIAKDISDYIKLHSVEQTKNLLRNLIS